MYYIFTRVIYQILVLTAATEARRRTNPWNMWPIVT